MTGETAGFYDSLAEQFDLIFENWDASMKRQASALGALLERELSSDRLRILDCACGIGTQALGLAARGHSVTGTDLSAAAVARARREASQRGLSLDFGVADMRDLSAVAGSGFDVVLAADNALPHMVSDCDLQQAARSIACKLKPGGLFVASIRDYDQAVLQRPAIQGPAFFTDGGLRRIVHQVWDWTEAREYTLHLYITRETEAGWECSHYTSRYRALLRSELAGILSSAGFGDIRWLMPEESRYYQPIALARRLSPGA